MNRFPKDIAHLIGEYAALWKVDEWVTKLQFSPKKREKISSYISRNSMAGDVINEYEIDWFWLSKNDAEWAIRMIEAEPGKVDLYHLCWNEHPRAIERVKELMLDPNFGNDEEWDMLSTNPSAVDILEKNQQHIKVGYLMWNRAAKPIIDNFKIELWKPSLASNPAPWAVDITMDILTRGEIEGCAFYALSGNTNPIVVKYLLEHPDLINWTSFSMNPMAIDYLRANPHMVKVSIYGNPAIFVPVIPAGVEDLLMEL